MAPNVTFSRQNAEPYANGEPLMVNDCGFKFAEGFENALLNVLNNIACFEICPCKKKCHSAKK